MNNLDKVISDIRKRAFRYQYKNYFSWTVITFLFVSTVYYFVEVGSNWTITLGEGATNNAVNIGGDTNIFDFLQGVVLKLGAVVLAAYLMRTLFIVAKYQQLAAESLFSKAEILELAYDDVEKMKTLVALAEFHKVEFEQSPRNPFDGALELLKDSVSKKTTAK